MHISLLLVIGNKGRDMYWIPGNMERKKKKRELNNFPSRTARELNDRSISSGRKSQGRADDHDSLILACCTAELVATFSRRQYLTTSELEL